MIRPYQSHHTGIETEKGKIQRITDDDYQSHHTGIETKKRFNAGNNQHTTNRTTLELKQYSLT